MALYLNACKVTFAPLIKDCKSDIEVMSTSNDSCEKVMKGNFFQMNHAESNCGKEDATPFLSKNNWIIPHLWALISQKLFSRKNNIEKKTEYLHILTLFTIGIFGAAHTWGGKGGEAKSPPRPLSKILHTYPTIMKFDTVIPYLKQIQKIYESLDTAPEFCWHQHFFTGNLQILLYQGIQI